MKMLFFMDFAIIIMYLNVCTRWQINTCWIEIHVELKINQSFNQSINQTLFHWSVVEYLDKLTLPARGPSLDVSIWRL